MKLKIKEGSIDAAQLKEAVTKNFEGIYKISDRSKGVIAVAASNNIGAVIFMRKKSILVNGNFPTAGRQMVFTLLVVFLGILIPLLVYFLVFHKKMKAVEKDVATFLKEHYSNEIQA
jgi:hypothetical protein